MTSQTELTLEYRSVDELIPYANNSRTHSEKQVTQIASSIKEFGFLQPVVIDADNGIITGHGRIMALNKLGVDKVPTIQAGHLTDAQRRAYVIADNKLNDNSGWDEELLLVELDALKDENFDIDVLGFEPEKLKEMADGLADDPEMDSQYTNKVATPIYEMKGDKPKLEDLCDKTKYMKMLEVIESSSVPNDIKGFLANAASRHIKFDYEKIAEYFAHADDDTQRLFENSALVIVDYDAAIENGYIQMTEKLMELSSDDK